MSRPGIIQIAGLSHHTAPVAVREALAFSRTRLPEALNALRSADGVEESVVLSTCNRVEVCLCSHAVQDEDFLTRFLAEFHGLDVEFFEPHLYRHDGADAVTHLFRVAAGLDSLVLGEAQITGQVREAYELAVEERTVGAVLHRLFQNALAVAKRVRSSSDIGQGRASIGSVAVQLAEHIFEDFARRTVLLVGAGEMGEVVLRSLRAAGARTTLVANRTFSRAEALAQECGGTAVQFDQLSEHLDRADIVISSTDAPHYVIRRAGVQKALNARRGRPIFLIDIAVPRDIDPAAADLDGCYLYNIDDLQAVVEQTLSRRRRELNRCLAMADDESRKFMQWVRGLHVAPTIAELRDTLHRLKQQEIKSLLNKLPDLPEPSRAAIERMADRLVNKILHLPASALRRPASNERLRGGLAAVRRIFGLEERPEPPAAAPELREGDKP